MDKKKLKKIIATALATLSLTGCSKKSECEIPSRHVHKYVKQITDDISIEKYRDSEYLWYYGYDWTPDYMEITKDDEKYYELLADNSLFVGEDNWDYLYNLMSNKHDYLMFYYEYWTEEEYYTTDSDGDRHRHTRRVYHDGWHKNPLDSDNTGRTRLYHHKYYGYRIINDGKKIKVEKSGLVDDIRDVIFDYPYFTEDSISKVYKEYKFNRRDLKYLSPDDFDDFAGPDLSTNELNIEKVKTID